MFDQYVEGKTTYASIYNYSMLYLFTVLTTVGYGFSTYSKHYEFLVAMLFMFFSPWLQPILINISMQMMKLGSNDFNSMLTKRLTEIDLWILKIQKQRKSDGMFLNPRLVRDIIKF